MAKMQTTIEVLAMFGSNQNSPIFLLGTQTGTSTLENSSATSTKTEHIVIL